jgi:hypothetical protein
LPNRRGMTGPAARSRQHKNRLRCRRKLIDVNDRSVGADRSQISQAYCKNEPSNANQ